MLLLLATVAVAAPASAGARVMGTSAWREHGAHNLGAVHSRRMTITLLLAPRHGAALKQLVSHRHTALSPHQFEFRFSPSEATVKSVRRWAGTYQLRVSSVSANRLLVKVSGSSKALGLAFHTGFDRFRTPSGDTFFQLTRAARLPASLRSHVSSIMGLSSLGRLSLVKPKARTQAGLNKVTGIVQGLGAKPGALPTLSYPSQYDPQQFWSMYDAPSSQTGSGQQLSIITEGDLSQPKKDLATFESKFGLPSVTWNQINVGSPSTDTSGDDEWDLDSQYSTGFAPGVSQLNVYVAPSLDDQDIASAVNRWVTDDSSKQGSFSAGECEILAYAAGFTSSLDTILEQAAAQGQTMFFASGDTGTQCPALTGVNGVPAGIPNVDYPASSPYGIGVGGTSVLSPTGPTEIAWYAGGGGTSLLEPTPAFQSSTKAYGGLSLPRRGVPDVSLDADPESGYEVIVSGTEEVIGGTSASTPAWQGIWARAEGAHGGSVGFAGPVLYGTEPASAYHDITLGTNGLPAGPGWDYATGLGTPDIAKLISGA
jgi:subtilase family serine protease